MNKKIIFICLSVLLVFIGTALFFVNKNTINFDAPEPVQSSFDAVGAIITSSEQDSYTLDVLPDEEYEDITEYIGPTLASSAINLENKLNKEFICAKKLIPFQIDNYNVDTSLSVKLESKSGLLVYIIDNILPGQGTEMNLDKIKTSWLRQSGACGLYDNRYILKLTSQDGLVIYDSISFSLD